MPADIVGTMIITMGDGGMRGFRFERGPIFANLVLADEINRAAPRTQSALLEAMQEGRATVAGETHLLPQPFFVLATQNPIEMEGTYPLPEAQLDRFLYQIDVPYPSEAELIEIARRTTGAEVPTGKTVVDGPTLLAMQALAASIDCAWKRVQFTPDLLPTDLIGVSVYERSNESFRFQPGPLFANIVLADEINRASPKTQSALLEAMEERQVSADGTTHPLPPPFMVIATQNPVEQEGTYRLPESQLDRFLLRISLGYPGRTAELAILDGQGSAEILRAMQPVVSAGEVMAMVQTVRSVYLASALKSYMVDLAEASRRHSAIELGLSPRATLQLAAAVRGRAATQGRDYATPDDVKTMAPSVLAHRLLLRAGSNARTTAEEAVRELLTDVPVPIAR
jgi:MoxR-like ATPase